MGHVPYTRGWCANEIYKKALHTEKTDMFSLALVTLVVLYGKSAHDWIMAQYTKYQDRMDKTDYARECPFTSSSSMLDNLITSCLCKDAERRPNSEDYLFNLQDIFRNSSERNIILERFKQNSKENA